MRVDYRLAQRILWASLHEMTPPKDKSVLKSLTRLYPRDAWRLLLIYPIFCFAFFGIQDLLKVLYILRLGHGPDYVGALWAVGALTYTATSLPAGSLGSHWGNHHAIRLGILLGVAGMASLPLVECLPRSAWDVWPFVSQILMTAGWTTLNINLVPSIVTAAGRARSGSVLAVASTLRSGGNLVGTIVGGALPSLLAMSFGWALTEPTSYRVGLLLGASVAMLALVMAAGVRTQAGGSQTRKVATGQRLFTAPLALLIVQILLSWVGWATCRTFASAFMDQELRLLPHQIGLVTGLGQTLAAVAPLALPALQRRHSSGALEMASTLAMAGCLAIMALSRSWIGVAVARIAVLGLSSTMMVSAQAFVIELAPSERQAVAYGAASMTMGLGFALVGFIGGQLVAHLGYRALFLGGAGFSAAGSLVMAGLLVARRRRSESLHCNRPVIQPAPCDGES